MTIALAELRQRLGDPDLTVVDVRTLPAYNGWLEKGAARGGHIPGAVAFPIAWLDSVDKPEVERLLQSKGILHHGEVVLYGDGPEDPVALKTRLAELGQTAVRIHRGGWAEWAGDPALPVDRLTNYATTRCVPTRRSPPTGKRRASLLTSGWRSIAALAGAPARRGSTHI